MKEKVLLVDDERDYLEIMKERMEARDIAVSTATSAAEALERIKTETFDAVILDLQMPGMDGIAAMQQMKEKQPELQVILLTGHATVEKGVEAIKLGAMDFVEKPADLELLRDKIKKARKQKMLIVEKTDKQRVLDALRRYGI